MKGFFKILLVIIPVLILGGYFIFKTYFNPENIKQKRIKTWNDRVGKFDDKSTDSIFSNDQKFIEESILKGKYKINIPNNVKDCSLNKYKKSDLIDEFEGFQNIGDIDKDGKNDFVFVLRPFCSEELEDGDSYYFSNPNIPRILTDSYCCHPYSIVNIGDIDEDGSNEIAQYYSSCSSRYKHFKLWTIKNNQWKELAEIPFTLNNEYEQFKDFHKLFKKLRKNEFQFLAISDVMGNGKVVKEWKTIKMN